MPDEPTEDIIRKEVAEAARILREDGHSVRLGKIEEKLNKHFPDEPEPANPLTPPKGDPKKSGEKRSSLWWGDQVE